MVQLERVMSADDLEQLYGLVREHFEKTGSPRAQEILDTWDYYRDLFWKVAAAWRCHRGEGSRTGWRAAGESSRGSPSASSNARSCDYRGRSRASGTGARVCRRRSVAWGAGISVR